ncbi:hypothetical protein BQ8482_400001 [Mesorhizobium delmotii]|uniref:Transposase n=1 Tax=Mesorhizobium delmotii TaxID=1631247 RepID=A0A2P9ASX8_9HYPH|nr:hypothetical protein BQ8482_400001 [Mesorhizobium delmotii]
MWARDIEAFAIPASVAGSREHRRAKTDRLDTELLMRAFLGWLRGENCSMAAIPTLEEGDERQPDRERQPLAGGQSQLVNRVKAILARFAIRSFHLGLWNGRQAHGLPHRGGNAAAGQDPRRALPLALAARSRMCADPQHRGRPPSRRGL